MLFTIDSQLFVPKVEVAAAAQHIHCLIVGKQLLDDPPIHWSCGCCWFISFLHVDF